MFNTAAVLLAEISVDRISAVTVLIKFCLQISGEESHQGGHLQTERENGGQRSDCKGELRHFSS